MDSFASSFSPPRPSILNNTSLKSLSLPIMVLEATMLVLDNSEYMRNGDYLPTRWEAQSDAVNIVFNAKTNSNPENNVGVMTMASKTPKVLVTLTQDIGKILSALHDSTIEGNSNVATGINIAQLALKHRQNKLQRQRIILFVGSPIADDEASLVALGKKLKKNSVAIDIVSFGEDEQNEDKLAKFVEAANSGENCHLLTIPAGAQLLSDVILSSPILQEEGDGAGPSGSGSGGGGGGGFEFGVDPSMDPELAMALRMSLEEEQARQRTAEGASGSGEALPSVAEGSEPASTSNTTSTSSAVPATPKPALAGSGSMVMQGAEPIAGVGAAADDDSEDAELQRALALSAGVGGDGDVEMASADTTATGGEAPRATVAGADGEDEEMSEEEAIARAIEMSLKENDDN